MLVFLIEGRLLWLAVVAALCWIVGVVGGGLLLTRMDTHAKQSDDERIREVEKMSLVSDQLLTVLAALFVAVGAVIAQLSR